VLRVLPTVGNLGRLNRALTCGDTGCYFNPGCAPLQLRGADAEGLGTMGTHHIVGANDMVTFAFYSHSTHQPDGQALLAGGLSRAAPNQFAPVGATRRSIAVSTFSQESFVKIRRQSLASR